MSYRDQLDPTRIPRHVAIIMDGNGRWAKQRGLERIHGHEQGGEIVKKITAECVRIGVKYLTLYTFSTENWNRPEAEVAGLMKLVVDSLEEEIFMKNNVRFRMIGDEPRLPQDVQDCIDQLSSRTAQNTAMTVTIAMSYSSRWEFTQVVKELVNEANSGKLHADDISEEYLSGRLLTSYMPDPDLLIRTGGEFRLSNYLLWQCAYSELYFCDTYWPDFDEEELCKAILNYQNRERRYGLTSEQVINQSETDVE